MLLVLGKELITAENSPQVTMDCAQHYFSVAVVFLLCDFQATWLADEMIIISIVSPMMIALI